MPSIVQSNQYSVLAGTVTKKATELQMELVYIVFSMSMNTLFNYFMIRKSKLRTSISENVLQHN